LSEADLDDQSPDPKVHFLNTEKIFDDCPMLVKHTIREMNSTLNTQLKGQFDEIKSLLDRMADIVVATEPKKSAFILDYRLGKQSHSDCDVSLHASSRSYAAKKRSRARESATKSTKKNACSGPDSPVLSGPSSQSGLGKRFSIHSLSTALPTKMIKV